MSSSAKVLPLTSMQISDADLTGQEKRVRDNIIYELELNERKMQKLEYLWHTITEDITINDKKAILQQAMASPDAPWLKKLHFTAEEFMQYQNLFDLLNCKIEQQKKTTYRSFIQDWQDQLSSTVQKTITRPLEKKMNEDPRSFQSTLYTCGVYISRVLINGLIWGILLSFDKLTFTPLESVEAHLATAGSLVVSGDLLLICWVLSMFWWIAYNLKDIKYYWNKTIYLFSSTVSWKTRLLWIVSLFSLSFSYTLGHSLRSLFPIQGHYVFGLLMILVIATLTALSFVKASKSSKPVNSRYYIYTFSILIICIISMIGCLICISRGSSNIYV